MVDESHSGHRTNDVFETTLGDLICALLEAANEISSDSREIEKLACAALANLVCRQAVP